MPPYSDINKSATCFLIFLAFHFASLGLMGEFFFGKNSKSESKGGKNHREKFLFAFAINVYAFSAFMLCQTPAITSLESTLAINVNAKEIFFFNC